jgi:hypothetical protein
MSEPISQVWTFPSDSNPDKEYETLRYTDGSLSCNCLGWTRRVAVDGSRSCKHTRWVDLGQAERHCGATYQYQTQTPLPHHAQRKIITPPQLGQRKLVV